MGLSFMFQSFFLLFGCFTAFCYLDVLLPLKTGSFSVSHAEVWLLCTNAGTSDYSVDHLLINLSRPSGTAETDIFPEDIYFFENKLSMKRYERLASRVTCSMERKNLCRLKKLSSL